MRRVILWVTGLAVFLAVGFWIYRGFMKRPESPGHETATARYQCAMHPEVVSDKPGNCPICHMALHKIEMVVRQPLNGTASSHKESERTEEKSSRAMASSRGDVSISSEIQQLIGVRVAQVERRPLALSLRTAGRIAYDPDLYQAMEEYREALRSLDGAKKDSRLEVVQRAEALVRSGGLRLRLLGLSESQISQIGKGDTAASDLLLGKKGGRLWVYGELYENEAPQVRVGQKVVITAPSLSQPLSAVVKAVDPIVSPMTRTAKFRAALENLDGQLLPEMYVHATIEIPLGEVLAVPQEAVLDTGERQIVFVEKAPGLFSPREIQAGQIAGGFYEVLSGLSEGERVVASAAFLIDSESRFQSARKEGTQHAH